MNWDDIKFFLAVADAGNLNDAANSLQVNHSTVFRRLAALEAELEQTLFERNSKVYTLSFEGERLLQVAREAQLALGKIETEIVGNTPQVKGIVRVSVPHFMAYSIMPLVIERVSEMYSEIRIEVMVAENYAGLLDRSVELACVPTSSPPSQFTGSYLLSYGWGLYASKQILKRRKTEGAETPVVLASSRLSASDSHQAAMQWAETEYSNVVSRCDSYALMEHLAQNDLGLTVLPDHEEYQGLTQVTRINATYAQLWLVSLPETRVQPAVQIVWDTILEEVSAAYG